MFRILLPMIAFLALPAAAEPEPRFVADAFGLAPSGAVDTIRTNWSGLRWKVGEEGRVAPPGQVDSILLFVGPKSLVAGKDEGHAVAIVVDAHGNLVRDETPTRIVVGDITRDVGTKTGIADFLFLPEPVARSIYSGASSGSRQSTRAMVRVVSDLGSVIPRTETGEVQTISTEALFDISTFGLLDRFGNVVEDGVAVDLALSQGRGNGTFAKAIVQGGVARATLLSRNMAGSTEAAVTIGRTTSPSAGLVISQADLLTQIDLRATALPDIDALRVRIGPFRTERGYVLQDGAPLTAAIAGETRFRPETTWTRDGYGEIVLPVNPDDLPISLDVTVLGTHHVLRLDHGILESNLIREIME